MKTKILMVCLGNICRSPLAEGILKQKVDPAEVTIDSAGTGGYHIGEKPDTRSIDIAAKYGLDISSQRCRKFDTADFDAFDHIYVMDKENYRNILALAPDEEARNKVRLLLEASGIPGGEVPDPYYGGESGFEKVYKLLDEACDVIANQLKTNKL